MPKASKAETLSQAVGLFDLTFRKFQLVEGCNCKSGGWCEVMLDCHDVLNLNGEKSALSNEKRVRWNITSDKKIGSDSASIDIEVRALPSRQMLESLGRNLEAEFLANFSDYALKVGFISLPMSPKKSNFPGMDDAGNIVPLLEQEAAKSVDNYGSCDLSVPKCSHVRSSS